MPYSYSTSTYSYSLDGQEVPWSTLDNARIRFQAVQSLEARSLARALTDGDLTMEQWLDQMRSLIKRTYVAEYLLGRGGRTHMTYGDWGRIGGLLSRQYRWLMSFADDISNGALSADQIAARAELYIHSALQAYERAKANARGIALPAYPGSGETQCGVNCRCHWSIVDADDHWEATWTLGASEHCGDCVARSQMWNPLVVLK